MMAMAGLATGLLGALGLARSFRTLLYGVAPSDPLALAMPALLLFVVTVVAAGTPGLARHADESARGSQR